MAARKGPGYDGKGYDARNGTRVEAGTDAHDYVLSEPSLTSSSEEATLGGAALSHLCMRTDGWLRVVPSEEGKVLFAKWKYTRGPYAGYYVMARVSAGDWAYAAHLLVAKLQLVAAGSLRPSLDSPYTE